MKSFQNGLTVKELKEIIADWAETDEYGEPTEVWIETGWCLSSVVVEVCPLNKREKSADLILSSAAFETPQQRMPEEDLLRTCGYCGHELQIVRPGKYQCVNPKCSAKS